MKADYVEVLRAGVSEALKIHFHMSDLLFPANKIPPRDRFVKWVKRLSGGLVLLTHMIPTLGHGAADRRDPRRCSPETSTMGLSRNKVTDLDHVLRGRI